MKHFIDKCKHGVVVRQCRCPGPKGLSIVACPPDCGKTVWASRNCCECDTEFVPRSGWQVRCGPCQVASDFG